MSNGPLRKFARKIKHFDHLPDSMYIPMMNTKGMLLGRKHRLSKLDDSMYQIEDIHGDKIIICQRRRHSRYKTGIRQGVEKLVRDYCLDHAHVQSGGAFIDCGANVGELGLWAAWNQLDYHAFEPEELESCCIDLNNYSGEQVANRCGLWNKTGELTLYSKSNSADSSLIEMVNYDKTFQVKTITLDDYVRQNDISRIEVLKVEAEGAEPEVLQGAVNSLSRCRFVTVDSSRERGVEKCDTIRDVCNLMYETGFEIVETNMNRFALLFKSKQMAEQKAA